MLTIDKYIQPDSLSEAYELAQAKNSVVLGGMLWLRLQTRKVGTAIDLCNLGLNKIEETANSYRIGAYVTLRELETHPGLNILTNDAIADSVSHIVGVQFRNTATVGGSIFGRFGFSDILTLFMALGASVELHNGGILPIEQFAEMGKIRDILTYIHIPKIPATTVYLAQRNTATDFPVLTTAISLREDRLTCAIGARPLRAVLFTEENFIANCTKDKITDFADHISNQTVFASNRRASEEYRRRICQVLVRRALQKIEKENF